MGNKLKASLNQAAATTGAPPARQRWIYDRVQSISESLARLETSVLNIEERCAEVSAEELNGAVPEGNLVMSEPMSQHEVELIQIESRVEKANDRIRSLLNRLRL